jgi:6-pyruvoyl tetrahydropterin synthase/QueD family protein
VYRIAKSIDVDFSHHVRGHSGPCINVHGHTWKLEVGLQAQTLGEEGFVVDFKDLKRAVLKPCHDLLDHALAVGEATFGEVESELAALGKQLLNSRLALHGTTETLKRKEVELAGARAFYPGGMKVAVFPFNPTSERLAHWLWNAADGALSDDRVSIAYTRIYETLHPVESIAEYWP